MIQNETQSDFVEGAQVEERAKALGTRWQDAVLDFADQHFAFGEMEAHDRMNVDVPPLAQAAADSADPDLLDRRFSTLRCCPAEEHQ